VFIAPCFRFAHRTVCQRLQADSAKAQLLQEIAAQTRRQQLEAQHGLPESDELPHSSPARRRLYAPYGSSGDSPETAGVSPQSAGRLRSDEEHSPTSLSGGKSRHRARRRPNSSATVESAASSQVSKGERRAGAYPRKGRQIVEQPAPAAGGTVKPVGTPYKTAVPVTSSVAVSKLVPHPPSHTTQAPPAHSVAHKPAHTNPAAAAGTQHAHTTQNNHGASHVGSVSSLGPEHSATLDGGSSTASDVSRTKRRGSLQQILSAASLVKVDLFGDEVDVTSIQQDITRNLGGTEDTGVAVREFGEPAEGDDSTYYLSAVQSMVGIDAGDAKNIKICGFYTDSPRAEGPSVKVVGMSLEDAFEYAGELDLPLEESPVFTQPEEVGEEPEYDEEAWEEEDDEPVVSLLAQKVLATPPRKSKEVHAAPHWQDEEVLEDNSEVPAYLQPVKSEEVSLNEAVEEVSQSPTEVEHSAAVKPTKEVRMVHASFAVDSTTAPTSREASKSRNAPRRKSTPSTRKMELASPAVSSAQLEEVFSENALRKSTPKLRKTPTVGTRKTPRSGASSRQPSRAASDLAEAVQGSEEGGNYEQEDFEDYLDDEFEAEPAEDEAVEDEEVYEPEQDVVPSRGQSSDTHAAGRLPATAKEHPSAYRSRTPSPPVPASHTWENIRYTHTSALDDEVNSQGDGGSLQGSPLAGLRLGGSVDFQDSLAYSHASQTLIYSPDKTGLGLGSTADFNYYISQPTSLYEDTPHSTQVLSRTASNALYAHDTVEDDSYAPDTGDNYSDDADFEQDNVAAQSIASAVASTVLAESPHTPGQAVHNTAAFSSSDDYSPSQGIAAAKKPYEYSSYPAATSQAAKPRFSDLSDSYDEQELNDFTPAEITAPAQGAQPASAMAQTMRRQVSPPDSPLYYQPSAASRGTQPAPVRSAGSDSAADEYADDNFETGENDADASNGGLLFFNDGGAVQLTKTAELPGDEDDELYAPENAQAVVGKQPYGADYSESAPSRPALGANYSDEEDNAFAPTQNSVVPPRNAALEAVAAPAPYAVRQFSMVVKDPEPSQGGNSNSMNSGAGLNNFGGKTYDAKREEVLRRIEQQQSVAEQEDHYSDEGSDGEFSQWDRKAHNQETSGSQVPSTVTPAVFQLADQPYEGDTQLALAKPDSTTAAAKPVASTYDSDEEYDFAATPQPSAKTPSAATVVDTVKATPAPYAVRQFSMIAKDLDPPTSGAHTHVAGGNTNDLQGGKTYDTKKEEVLRRIEQQQSVVEQEDHYSDEGSDGEFAHWDKTAAQQDTQARNQTELKTPAPAVSSTAPEIVPTVKPVTNSVASLPAIAKSVNTAGASVRAGPSAYDSDEEYDFGFATAKTTAASPVAADLGRANESTTSNGGYGQQNNSVRTGGLAATITAPPTAVSEQTVAGYRSDTIPQPSSVHAHAHDEADTGYEDEGFEDDGDGLEELSVHGDVSPHRQHADSEFPDKHGKHKREKKAKHHSKHGKKAKKAKKAARGGADEEVLETGSSEGSDGAEYREGYEGYDQEEFGHLQEDAAGAAGVYEQQWDAPHHPYVHPTAAGPQQQYDTQHEYPAYYNDGHGGELSQEQQEQWPDYGEDQDGDTSVYSHDSRASKKSSKSKSKAKKDKKSKGKHKHKHAKYAGQEELVIEEDGSSEGSSVESPRDQQYYYGADQGVYEQGGYYESDMPVDAYDQQQYVQAEGDGYDQHHYQDQHYGQYTPRQEQSWQQPQQHGYGAGYGQQQDEDVAGYEGDYGGYEEYPEQPEAGHKSPGMTKKEKKHKHKSKHGKHKGAKHKSKSKQGSPTKAAEGVLDEVEDLSGSEGSSEDEFDF
jgi:hypothetical protein